MTETRSELYNPGARDNGERLLNLAHLSHALLNGGNLGKWVYVHILLSGLTLG
jgi:hypothetical protein